MYSHYYLIGDAGELRFTPEGLCELSSYFAKAGIDIRNINTLEAYYSARKQASPFIMERLKDRASGWPETDQFELLRTAVFGSTEELNKKVEKFDRKQSFHVVK